MSDKGVIKKVDGWMKKNTKMINEERTKRLKKKTKKRINTSSKRGKKVEDAKEKLNILANNEASKALKLLETLNTPITNDNDDGYKGDDEGVIGGRRRRRKKRTKKRRKSRRLKSRRKKRRRSKRR